jgi:hypothetical protein
MVDEIEKKYLNILKRELSGNQGALGRMVKKKYFFDRSKNIGFLITRDDFYVFTKVKPYTLFERKNGKHYAFCEAKVGAILTGKNWGKLIVVDNYTHPSLPEFNKSFQQICSGDFDYNKIKRKNPENAATQIVDLLHKGRRMLTTEYVSSEKEWYQLTDSIFDAQIVRSSEGVKPLNI